MTTIESVATTTTAKAIGQWRLITVWNSSTICGPKMMVSTVNSVKRASRPAKTETQNRIQLISATPAQNTNNLNGVGGGNMEGTINAHMP